MQVHKISELLKINSPLSGGNLDYIEGLFDSWLSDPQSVSEEWRRYFEALPLVPGSDRREFSHAQIIDEFRGLPRRGQVNGAAAAQAISAGSFEHEAKQSYS